MRRSCVFPLAVTECHLDCGDHGLRKEGGSLQFARVRIGERGKVTRPGGKIIETELARLSWDAPSGGGVIVGTRANGPQKKR